MSTAGDPAAFFTEVAAAHSRCFWLDGGGAREWSGRRSIIGWLDHDDVSLSYSSARREVTRHASGRADVVGDDVFAVLEAELAGGAASDQWFGYLGYASRPDLPARPDPLLPDAVWMRARNVRLFDHEPAPGSGRVPDAGASTVLRHTTPHPTPPPTTRSHPTPPPTTRSHPATTSHLTPTPPPGYRAAFERVQEHLHAGNSYEVNLTHRLDAPPRTVDGDPVATYLRLRVLNPAPYAGFLQHDVPDARAWLLSSSPERYALVGADRTIETKPIKGTTARGSTDADDERLRLELATHPRFRAENLMIVDLLRNDLSQVCVVGSVVVPTLMAVESYETVHQLVSTVRGRLRDDVSTVAALQTLFPAGSMTGAPKLRTMQIVEEVEATPRGAYSGAFGWVSGDGRADLGVVIRSLMTAGPVDGAWPYRLGTGGGITVQSDVDGEWSEAVLKAERILESLDP